MMSELSMSTTAIQDFRRIWRATTVQRDHRSMMQLGWLALTVAVLGALGAGLIVLKHQESPLLLLRMLSGVAAGWLGLVWMLLFVPASILLNSPANARLVPRQRRRLIQMAAASWLLITLGVTAATGVWAAFPAAGLSLVGFALMRAGRNEAAPLFIVGINWPSLSRHVLPPAVVDAVASDAGLLILSALLLPAGLWALRSLYPAGGDSHLARRGEQVKRAAWFGREGWANGGEGGRLSRWTSVHVYRAMFKRALRRPRPGPMLMHALGPAAHWSAWIGAVTVMLLVSAGLRLMLAWRGEAALRDFLNGALGSGLVAMVIIILFSTVVFGQQIRKTAGEQSLLRLTPLAGEAALLNRRLARELLKNALRNWAMLTALILLSTIMVGGGREIVLREGALCVLAGQVATMGLLGDFADHGGWSVARAVQAGLLAVVEMVVAMVLARTGVASTWTWLSAIAIGVGAVLLVRAWRRMLAAPPAFPAGRIA
jgi:hypothetical protein